MSIHTWPEHGYAAVDLFTCGDTVSSEAVFAYLREALQAGHIATMELQRGQVILMSTPGHTTDGRPQSSR